MAIRCTRKTNKGVKKLTSSNEVEKIAPSLAGAPGGRCQALSPQISHQVGHLNGSDGRLSSLVAHFAAGAVQGLQGRLAEGSMTQGQVQAAGRFGGMGALCSDVG